MFTLLQNAVIVQENIQRQQYVAHSFKHFYTSLLHLMFTFECRNMTDKHLLLYTLYLKAETDAHFNNSLFFTNKKIVKKSQCIQSSNFLINSHKLKTVCNFCAFNTTCNRNLYHDLKKPVKIGSPATITSQHKSSGFRTT